MNRLDGPSTTQILRNNNCTIPIIGLTGNVLKEDIQYFIDHGANSVLTKPLSFNKFIESLSNISK